MSKLTEPLMLDRFRQLLTEYGQHQLRRSMVINCITGVLDGIALLTILPLATTLAATLDSETTDATTAGLGLTGWLIVLAVLAVTGGVLKFIDSEQTYKVGMDFIRNSQLRLGNHLTTLPLGWFTQQKIGRLSHLLSDGFMSAGNGLIHQIPVAISSAASLVTVGIGSWIWDWRLGAALTVAGVIAVVLMLLAQRMRRMSNTPVGATDAELASRIVEYASCQPALRAAGRSESFTELQQACQASDRARFRQMWWSTLAVLLNGISAQAITVIMIVMAAILAVSGELTAAATIAYIGMVLRFTHIVTAVSDSLLGVEEARIPMDSVEEVMSAEPLPEPESPAPATRPGAVELRNVTFGYQPENPVVSDLNLSLEPQTMTALVGPSGSGKTTVARLISRFWDVNDGAVFVDGTDIRERPLEDLMGRLSMVFQDVYLFDDTLEANIRIGQEGASDDEVRRAADQAGVTAIAQRLEHGWATPVGEGGRALSGGERQRVSIARALVKKAPIVLFDEATSALDGENEANVLASMNELRAEATLLVIAHKLDTIRTADQIVVLTEDGAVDQVGTHEQLYAGNGFYRRFWDRRKQATGWTLTSSGSTRD